MAQQASTPITFGRLGPGAAKGRGALSNESGRFERFATLPVEGDWPEWEERPRLHTTVTVEKPKTIVTTNRSPDISFKQSINPYRGCEHGCIYCFARPTHAFMGLSPGQDFESRLFAKPNAAELLERELSDPDYVPKTIAIGTNTDAYQPIERRYEIMRGILKVLEEFDHPVGIVTKSHLVTRDIDILGPMAERGLAKVFVSVTTLNPKLARAMEPRASTPSRRIEALKDLAEAGIPTGVMVAPVIPALNDAEIEAILDACADAGALQAGYIMLRLPLETKFLFREWLETVVPNRADHIMRRVRDLRGGRDYESGFGVRMTGRGAYAKMIADRFRVAAKRRGLNRGSYPLNTSLFRNKASRDDQLTLF